MLLLMVSEPDTFEGRIEAKKLTFMLAMTGVWYRRSGWSFSRSKEMFHNSERWIWGMQITIASCVLQISNEKDWLV